MVGMLAAGVGLRTGLDAAQRRVRHRGEPSEWAGAWAQRAEWLGGYPPTAAEVPSTAELVNRVVSDGQP